MQPLIQSLGGYLSTNNEFLLQLSYLYFIILIIESRQKINIDISVGPNNHLVWNRLGNNGILGGSCKLSNNILNMLYLFGLLIPPLFVKDGIFLSGFGLYNMKKKVIAYGVGYPYFIQ